jgi:hypothetical protein
VVVVTVARFTVVGVGFTVVAVTGGCFTVVVLTT